MHHNLWHLVCLSILFGLVTSSSWHSSEIAQSAHRSPIANSHGSDLETSPLSLFRRRIKSVRKTENKRDISTIAKNRKILNIRGGLADNETPTPVLVSTSFGSDFLDKKKRLTILKNSTVAELKSQIQQKFPGSPPIQLQNLYFTSRYLADDDELVSNLTALSPIPILLDMVCGTSVYNRTLSITQAIDAYAATVVQQSFLGEKMRSILSLPLADDDSGSATNITKLEQRTMDAVLYRRMYEAVKNSVYKKYSEDIEEALEAEKEPETLTLETIAWRKGSTKEISPIAAAMAKEFDLNGRGMRSFLYYSIVLVVFAFFGTNSYSSKVTLLLSIPVLWVSKLRQLRLASKIALYLVLPVLPTLDFLMPLFPATLQTIALESRNWQASEGEYNIRVAPEGARKRTTAAALNKEKKSAVVVEIKKESTTEDVEDAHVDVSEKDEEEEDEEEEEDDDDDEDEYPFSSNT
jgi:hypothetical protein